MLLETTQFIVIITHKYKHNHNHVRDILYDVFWQAEVQLEKKALVNFLIDPREGRSTLRPTEF